MKKESVKLRICILGPTYPRHDADPEVPWLRKSIRLLANRGHKLTVIAPSWRGLRSHWIDGIRVMRFRYAPSRLETLAHAPNGPDVAQSPLFRLLALPYMLMGMLALAYWARRERFDLIHVHWPFPHALMAMVPARLLGIKMVATCHGAEPALARRNPWVKKIMTRLFRHAAVCSCRSSHMAAEFAAIFENTPQVIPYGATTGCLPLPRPLPADPHAPAILFFSGRLSRGSGLEYLIRALPEILRRRKVRLCIAGAGRQLHQLQDLAKSLGVSGAVDFLVNIGKEERASLFRTCDIYVHPAISGHDEEPEPIDSVLAEALLHERPVIASAADGATDVIKHRQTGLLVPEKSAAALARAILRLLEQPHLARNLGRAGREYAEWHLDWVRITDRTEEMFYQATARPIPKPRAHEREPIFAPVTSP